MYGRSLSLTNNVTPMMSVVVGLLLVFRNTSAYGRWDEGRKVFNKMVRPRQAVEAVSLACCSREARAPSADSSHSTCFACR